MSSAQPRSDHERRLWDEERLAALSRTGLMDGVRPEAFGRIARLTPRVVGSAAAFVSVIGADSRRFLGALGLTPPDETPLEGSLCQSVVTSGGPVAIADARADGQKMAAFDTGELGIVAYCGAPIFAAGHAIGVVAAVDFHAREWSEEEVAAISDLAALASTEVADRLAEDSQREQRRRVFGLTNRLPIGVYVCDRDGRLGYYNDRMADLWGFRPEPGTSEAAAFRAVKARVKGAELAAADLPCGAALETLTGIENQEVEVGDNRSVLVSSALIRDRAGGVLGAAAVVHDVTLVRQAERLRDELLSLVSHELRTPLTVINGVASLLDRRWTALPEDARAVAVADIVSSGKRIDRALANMLMLSRIAYEMADSEPLNLRQVIADALADHQRLFPSSSVTVRMAEPAPVALGVESWLRLNLANLLANAELYGDGSEPVLVEVETDGGEVVVRVCNPGIVLSPSDYDRIFDPFYRRAPTAITVPGAGLGLTVARRLTEAQGGTVSAGPRLDRDGTLVTLRLPLAMESADVDGRRVSAGANRAGKRASS